MLQGIRRGVRPASAEVQPSRRPPPDDLVAPKGAFWMPLVPWTAQDDGPADVFERCVPCRFRPQAGIFEHAFPESETGEPGHLGRGQPPPNLRERLFPMAVALPCPPRDGRSHGVQHPRKLELFGSRVAFFAAETEEGFVQNPREPFRPFFGADRPENERKLGGREAALRPEQFSQGTS